MAKLKQPVKKAEKNVLQLYLQKGRLEAGCDEAGRGCLAGPVVAAAVILPPDFKNDLLTDSKELTEKERDLLRPLIETQALAYAIGVVSHTEIDQINILNASFLAMHRAIAQLSLVPEHLLIDGNRFNLYPNIPHTCIIKGMANTPYRGSLRAGQNIPGRPDEGSARTLSAILLEQQ